MNYFCLWSVGTCPWEQTGEKGEGKGEAESGVIILSELSDTPQVKGCLPSSHPTSKGSSSTNHSTEHSTNSTGTHTRRSCGCHLHFPALKHPRSTVAAKKNSNSKKPFCPAEEGLWTTLLQLLTCLATLKNQTRLHTISWCSCIKQK